MKTPIFTEKAQRIYDQMKEVADQNKMDVVEKMDSVSPVEACQVALNNSRVHFEAIEIAMKTASEIERAERELEMNIKIALDNTDGPATIPIN